MLSNSKMKYQIPFNKPFIVGKEMYYISESILGGHSAGDGPFTTKCQKFLEDEFDIKKVLLTHSYAASFDMAALICGTKPGDEIIVQSFAYVSAANAFYMRGAKPIFVDIRKDTLNIDEAKIESAITDRTIAIIISHYAGDPCEIEIIKNIARKHQIYLIEDAANSFNTIIDEKYLGTTGDLGIYSFHETNPIMCGEGGALLINNPQFREKAEIVREKGTNRSRFIRGEVDKYTWVDIGSSLLPSDILAAFLYAQLENIPDIFEKRRYLFDKYIEALKPLAERKLIELPNMMSLERSRSQFFYIVLDNENIRKDLIDHLKRNGILSVFHYIPLHLSTIGKSLGYVEGQFPVTEKVSKCLLRLPFYNEIKKNEFDYVIKNIFDFFKV